MKIFTILILLNSFNIGLYSQPINIKGGNLEYVFPKTENCLPEEDRTLIIKTLQRNRKELIKKGLLIDVPDERNKDVLYEWPITSIFGLKYNSAWAISNYVDHDATSGIQDYNCLSITYNDHKGTDIFTWPFTWYLVNNSLVNAIAVAPGTIILKQDGNPDDHCSCSGSWNAVYLEHLDGSVTWYGHLKSGSLTEKSEGATVETGEYLGVVASSGCSTGPHLHLEVYTNSDYTDLIDPFAGTCNTLNTESCWNDQIDYKNSNVNAVFTHSQLPDFGCPSANENAYFDNVFLPGEVMYTLSYFRDQISSTQATSAIRRPDNVLWNTWQMNFTNNYSSSYWWNSWNVPNGPYGTWQVETKYNNITVTHEFQILESEPSLPEINGIGVNTTDPKSALHIHNGDVYVDNAENGLILKSKNGNCYRLIIDNNGQITHELLDSCPN